MLPSRIRVVSRQSQPGAGAREQQPARLRGAELHVERVPRRVEANAAAAGPKRREQPRLAGLVRALQHVLQSLAERLVMERAQQAVVHAVRNAEHLLCARCRAGHGREWGRLDRVRRRRRPVGALRLNLELGDAVGELVRVLLQLLHQRLQNQHVQSGAVRDARSMWTIET
jgi:hypothetical protein